MSTLSTKKKVDYDHLRNRNKTQISFKKSLNIYNFRVSRTNFNKGETIAESFEKFSKMSSKWRRKKKRTRGRTVAANTDLCHCARFISVRHSTSHIFEPHRIFQTRINRVSLSAYHKRNHQCSIFPYFSTTIRRIIYSTC